MIDPIILLQELIRCKSVTPDEGGAISLLEKLLTKHGFECHRLKFSNKDTPDVENLYARWGTNAPNLCFAGHTDVVPVGDPNGWTCDPFGGEIKDGYIWGRGTCDMKGGVAAFVAATLNFIEKQGKNYPGSISLLITGDEEGPAINGTKKVLEWMDKHGEKIDFCIVGEPTSRETLGDTIRIGRRGSFTGEITVEGVQGHVAYPKLADNPIPKLLTLLKTLDDLELDQGTEIFDPSNLEIVNINIGNTTTNVIPAAAHATFNVRFNDHYTSTALEEKLRSTLDALRIPYQMNVSNSGESSYTPPDIYSEMIQKIIQKITDLTPKLSTTGGTSDARFIKNYCSVIEFGLVGKTFHKIDERVLVKDVHTLADIYTDIIKEYPRLYYK
ncbi:MAG: succinyl-diaminopimelate desuccinylase [Alphaproteobacteria bacterium]|nr:succinyl-diaminopimelate desuccinylase [Alphaproteobacteria bacterium]